MVVALGRRTLLRIFDCLEPDRQPEVSHLGLAVRGEEDVARLEVEVKYAGVASMGVMDRSGDLFDEHGGRARVKLVPFEPILDGPSLHQFHDEKPAATVLAEKKSPDDTGMLHPGDRSGVLAEAEDCGFFIRSRPL